MGVYSIFGIPGLCENVKPRNVIRIASFFAQQRTFCPSAAGNHGYSPVLSEGGSLPHTVMQSTRSCFLLGEGFWLRTLKGVVFAPLVRVCVVLVATKLQSKTET